jgi:putative transposase
VKQSASWRCRACPSSAQIQGSTCLYQARLGAEDGVRQQIAALAQAHPRYGSRRNWAVIRRGRRITRKRVHRSWKQARLQVRPVKRHQVRRERPAVVAAAYPNHVWAYDFLGDRDAQGRVRRILTVMDEFTREGLAIDGAPTTSAERVIGVLGRLVALHGALVHIQGTFSSMTSGTGPGAGNRRVCGRSTRHMSRGILNALPPCLGMH